MASVYMSGALLAAQSKFNRLSSADRDETYASFNSLSLIRHQLHLTFLDIYSPLLNSSLPNNVTSSAMAKEIAERSLLPDQRTIIASPCKHF